MNECNNCKTLQKHGDASVKIINDLVETLKNIVEYPNTGRGVAYDKLLEYNLIEEQ